MSEYYNYSRNPDSEEKKLIQAGHNPEDVMALEYSRFVHNPIKARKEAKKRNKQADKQLKSFRRRQKVGNFLRLILKPYE